MKEKLNAFVRWLAGLVCAVSFAQAQTADVQAISATVVLAGGEPAGEHPASLYYRIKNNGPNVLSNQNYVVELVLAPQGQPASAGVSIGSATTTVTCAVDATNATLASTAFLANYLVPGGLASGVYQSWLHVTPGAGAPVDTDANNNWVAGTFVVIPGTGEGKAFTYGTLAGARWQLGGADGLGTAARFNAPYGIAVDGWGNAYIADARNSTIRKMTPDGAVTTLAGTAGAKGSADGFFATARFNLPLGVAASVNGTVYVADTQNHTIRKISPAGIVTTLAGLAGAPGVADGTGAAARFAGPCAVAVDGGGNVYVADTWNHAIRKITPAGVVTTLAGTCGLSGFVDGTGMAARFNAPQGIAVDMAENVFVSDTRNQVIRQVLPTGKVVTLAGMPGAKGASDGNGPLATFNDPTGLTVDSRGYLYICDSGNHTIRGMGYGGNVTTLGGLAGNDGLVNDWGPNARFFGVQSIALNVSNNLIIADTYNNVIRSGTLVPTAEIATLSSPTNGGSVTGSGFVPIGLTTSLKAIPHVGWRFTGWSDSNTENPRTVTCVAGGSTYTAQFTQFTNTTLTILLQAGDGGASGIWTLGEDYKPALWTSVSGMLGGGWALRALDRNHILLQQGTGGVAGIWELVNNVPVRWTQVLNRLPGWIVRDFDNHRLLMQFGDGGIVAILTLNASHQQFAWKVVSGNIPGLIARSLAGNRILLQAVSGNPAGFWTLDGGNNITTWTPLNTTVPAGWVLRSWTKDFMLLQQGDGGAIVVWDLSDAGLPTGWHIVSYALPGWIARGINEQ